MSANKTPGNLGVGGGGRGRAPVLNHLANIYEQLLEARSTQVAVLVAKHAELNNIHTSTPESPTV